MSSLFSRDYKKLTPDELAQLRKVQAKEVVKLGALTLRSPLPHKYSKAARHFLELFPNHYLDERELKERKRLTGELNAFKVFLNSKSIGERRILNYLQNKRAYFIIGALLQDFRFGHHGAFLFPEFQLGNSFKIDFLLVGRNSGGWEFVFIEFEAPKGGVTLKNGELGRAFRKGLQQIADWKVWLEARYSSLRETFDKATKLDDTLPEEFTSLDSTRLHFVVVAGRRHDFTSRTYRIKRELVKDRIHLYHYDGIVDLGRRVIGKMTF